MQRLDAHFTNFIIRDFKFVNAGSPECFAGAAAISRKRDNRPAVPRVVGRNVEHRHIMRAYIRANSTSAGPARFHRAAHQERFEPMSIKRVNAGESLV